MVCPTPSCPGVPWEPLTLAKRTLLGLRCEPRAPKHHTLQVSPQPDSRSWSCPGECAFWRTDDIYVVQMREQELTRNQLGLHFFQCGLSTQREKRRGIMATPCSLPSPCTILWEVPSSSSHTYVDAVPWNMETKGTAAPCTF